MWKQSELMLKPACLTLPACLPACLLASQCASAVTRQTALERQDVSRTYPAHHELESLVIIIIIIVVIIIIVIIVIIRKGWW